MPRVIVPPGPGAFSAMGMLMADVAHDLARTRITDLANVDAESLEADYRELETLAESALETDGFAEADRVLTRTADIRYQGQEHTVAITCRPASSTRPWRRRSGRPSGRPTRRSTATAPRTRWRS